MTRIERENFEFQPSAAKCHREAAISLGKIGRGKRFYVISRWWSKPESKGHPPEDAETQPHRVAPYFTFRNLFRTS
jgi:hypothetical protein